MQLPQKAGLIIKILLALVVVCAVTIGAGLGLALAATRNIEAMENIGEYQPALPSQILDGRDNLITEFFSDEKREIVSIDELPKHLIYALITREDQDFFNHNGFSMRGSLRALWNVITGSYFSGGSTITQQLAGHLYANRNDISVTRKLKELWWAFQLERSLTKYEILEKYLNKMYFGAGTYGVEAASQFYFGHSSRQITLAESVVLVIQLANSVRYNPIKYPNRLKKLQYELLQQMVRLGYCIQSEVDISYEEYWNNYNYTRSTGATAFLEREDKAPYFSEHIRQQLEELLYGSLDIYKDGFIVHTTLNMDYQRIADQHMAAGIAKVNADYLSNADTHIGMAEDDYIPIIDLLALSFNIDGIRVAGSKDREKAKTLFKRIVTPSIDMFSMMFGLDDLKLAAKIAYAREKKQAQRTTVEGALITLDNSNGQLLAMVGGSQFESINQFNRATQAQVQPGSAFKPLYYAAAIESRKVTPATLLYDSPVVFWNDDGTPYAPLNFKGEWKGPVLTRFALSQSMNIPSLKVLDMVGFDYAIAKASELLGITAPDQIARIFPRKYPLGLGIISVAPIQMVKAFSTFANGGREIVPIAIRYIEDRTGKIILEPEKDAINQLRKKGRAAQIISPQTAYILTSMLQTTVESGTLSYSRNSVGGFSMPMAGKTGTTQNWSDAWTVGYSPYYTTAVWFGFDQPGNSLGVSQTGAISAGPVWARMMKDIHNGLEPRSFARPSEGLIEVSVTARSGLLPPNEYQGKVYKEIFLSGTEPRRFDDLEEFEQERNNLAIERIRRTLLTQDIRLDASAIPAPQLRLDQSILPDPTGRRPIENGKTLNPLLD